MRHASGFTSFLLALAVVGLFVWWGLGPSDPGARNAGQNDAGTPVAKIETPAPAPAPAQSQAQPIEADQPQQPHAVPQAGAPAPNLLAREQAEAERLAALKEKSEEAPPKSTPKRETKLYYKVKVRDGGTLETGGKVISLAGIAARGADESCVGAAGKSWACGAAARLALTRLIRSRAVTCTLPSSGETKEFVASCSVAGTDLANWVVRQGWAEPKAPADSALAEAAEAARRDRVGLWRAAE